jgi:hypothetical protein
MLIRLAAERASLRHRDEAGLQIEIHVSHVDLRPSGHVSAEGAANSRRVLSAIVLKVGGVGMAGFSVGRVFCGATTRGLTLRKKASGFSLKFSGKLKPVMHYPVSTTKVKTTKVSLQRTMIIQR